MTPTYIATGETINNTTVILIEPVNQPIGTYKQMPQEKPVQFIVLNTVTVIINS